LALFLSLLATQSVFASTAIERTANMTGNEASNASQKALPQIELLVSIRPLQLILQTLIKDSKAWHIQTLVPPQSSLHDFQFKPSDVVKLKKANLVFWLGASAEPSLAKAIDRFAVPSVALDQAQVKWRSFVDDSDESIGMGHDDHEHGSNQLDPHIWLSLPQIPEILRFYSERLQALLESSQAQFDWSKHQVMAQKAEIQENMTIALGVHQAVTKKLSSLQATWTYNRYISFHNAFGYLDEMLKVQSLGYFVQNPEDGISPRQLRLLQNVVKDEQLGCLLSEPFADGRDIEALIDKSVPIVDLDITGSSLPGTMDWRGYWEYLIEQFQQCFGSVHDQDPAASNLGTRSESRRVKRPQKEESRILEKLLQWQ